MIKRILLSFTIACATTMSIAQSPCAQSIDSRTFGHNLQQMRVMPNDMQRINRALQFVEVYCLNSVQLFDLASLFAEDNHRFDVVAAGYAGMTDRENAFALLDVFKRFSTAFRAYDYFNFVDRGHNRPSYWSQYPMQPVVPVQPAQPPVVIPQQPVCMVSEQEMQEVRSSIKGMNFDGSMLEQAKMLLRTKKCFTTDQIISIVKLFSFSGSQVEVSKFAYDFCVDKDNYFRIIDILTFDGDKKAVRDHINSRQ
jgi:hypothetical protein